MKATSLLIAASLLTGTVALAENSNDPTMDINTTSIGTRMRNYGSTTANAPTSGPMFSIYTNSGIGERMGNATPDHAMVTNETYSNDVMTTPDPLSPRYVAPAAVPVVVGTTPRARTRATTSNTVNSDTRRTATMESSNPANTRTGAAGNSNLTADDQSNSPADMALTRRIRQDVMKRDFSMMGKNVKIITINGVVTLKGDVASTSERQSIESIAATAAGRNNVRNEITIKQ